MILKSNSKAHLTGIIFILAISMGCVTPKKMDKWAATQYGESISLKKNRSDYFTVNSPMINDDPAPSSSTKRMKKFLPLIVYWKYGYQTSCNLNAKIPINTFVTSFTTQANSKKLKQKLDGATLELTINKIPTSVSFNSDGGTVWVLLYAISWEKVYLLPENRDMSISYRVLKDGTETKKGDLIIPDANKTKQPRYLQSIKKATYEYFGLYDENIKAMARATVEQLVDVLD